MRRILPTARVGAAILLRVSPRAANRTVNSPYCDPDGNAQIDQDDVNLIFAAWSAKTPSRLKSFDFTYAR